MRAHSNARCGAVIALLLSASGAFAQAPTETTGESAGQAAAAPVAPAASGTSSSEPRSLAESLDGEAERNYELGRLLYDNGDYEGALARFDAAHQMSGDDRLLWNAAICHKAMHHYAQAIIAMRGYLASSALISDSDATSARNFIAAAERLTARLEVSSNVSGAAVSADGQSMGSVPLRPDARLDWGTHQIVVKKPGYTDYEQTVVVSASSDMRVVAVLRPVVHEGRVIVRAGSGDLISIDGQERARTSWEGVLPSGAHWLRVSASGFRTHEQQIVVTDAQTRGFDRARAFVCPARLGLGCGQCRVGRRRSDCRIYRHRSTRPAAMKSRVLVFAALAVSSALLLASCSSHDSGELVVVVTTDLSMPADIDWLDWTIVRPSHAPEQGSLSLDSFDSLPGTLAVISGKDGAEPVQITLNGRSGGAGGTLRVTREARLNMPIGEKMLEMPLTWLCSDGNQKPDCAAGTTCQAGRCVDSTISEPLAAFVPLAPAQCFDVLDCTLKGARYTLATPNLDPTTGDCIIDSNSLIARPFNVALQINPGAVGNAGVCSAGANGSCFVMLNQDDTPDGWQLVQNAQQETVARLPMGVWDAIGRGSVQKVALTHNECPLKTSDAPVCQADFACLVSPSSCPGTFPDTWVGYSCSGPASPSDTDSKLEYCGISDSDPALPPTVPGHFCCTAGQAIPSTPLLIDDMSGGPLIKFPPQPNNSPAAGSRRATTIYGRSHPRHSRARSSLIAILPRSSPRTSRASTVRLASR